MTQLVFLIEQISSGAYLLCAVGLLFNLRSLMLARRELAGAEFELERDFALRRQARSVTWALAFVELMLGIYAVAHIISPTLRNDSLPTGGQSASDSGTFQTLVPGQATVANAQGTPISRSALEDPFLTLTAQPANLGGAGISVTEPPSPTPPGTIEPGAPPPIGCNSPEAALQVPANGQVLYESVTVLGTAQTANFARYKFELSGPSTGNAFAPFGGDKTTAVTSLGVLGQLPLVAFQPGTYRFRLVVFDATGQIKASCTITVNLRLHPPTPSPTPTPLPTSVGK